jgi:hypothetical protein
MRQAFTSAPGAVVNPLTMHGDRFEMRPEPVADGRRPSTRSRGGPACDVLRASEDGITKANVDEQLKSANPEVKRVLGVDGNFGEQLGLTKDWVYRIVKHVGNYGEVFERNVGQNSPLKIARGLNALWTKGGIQYAPPIR